MSTYRLKGASGAVINQSFTLGERAVIGRADDCDVRLDQAGVAPRHAAITLDSGGGLTLESLDAGSETLLNGEAVTRAQLASGDEIRIANCRFVLQAPGLRPAKVLTAGRGRRVVRRPPQLPALSSRPGAPDPAAQSSSGMPSRRCIAM
jgi:pSer/pThr/pTyr-binding forkhead associated (FHA) protein